MSESGSSLIKMRCPSCQQKLGFPDKAAGRNARCPSCHHVLRVAASGEATDNVPPAPFASAPSPSSSVTGCAQGLSRADDDGLLPLAEQPASSPNTTAFKRINLSDVRTPAIRPQSDGLFSEILAALGSGANSGARLGWKYGMYASLIFFVLGATFSGNATAGGIFVGSIVAGLVGGLFFALLGAALGAFWGFLVGLIQSR